jgi:molybdopterin-dependent oxidoreductase alpha subunit
MGGQSGGMVDESGRFPEVCKKSMQAMAADMQAGIPDALFAEFGFHALRQCTPHQLEHFGRLVHPLYAGTADTHLRPISWDEALQRCTRRLTSSRPDDNFFYVSGRSSNEAAFLIHLFARLYGTNNVNNCSYYCHQASGVGLSSALGTGTATVLLDDLRQCDLVFLIGGNPSSNHPRLMRQLVNLRRRGGHVVVINPVRETGLVNFAVPSDLRSLLFGSPIASHYVQPHIGGDIALLSGIAKRLDEIGAVSEGFIAAYTEDGPAWRQELRALDWDDIVQRSGVDLPTIDRLARLYAESQRAIFAWTMGITQHAHGVDNVRAIVNLALMRGMVGRPGAGLLPIRGHSNVQGVGSVGVTPKLKQAIFDAIQEKFGLTLPTTPGLDTLSCVDAMYAGRLRCGWALGGNLFGATPDARRARTAFSNLEWICYFSTTLNTGHAWGRAKETLILPMLARDEEAQSTTQESMFNFVRLSDGGPQRHEGPRSEVETVSALAAAVLGDTGPINWRDMHRHDSIREMIAAVVPGYEKIARVGESREEFQIEGRTLHAAIFKTPSGRARFQRTPIPPNGPFEVRRAAGSDAADGCLRLMTIRSEGQFNTVVYEEEDIYRHQERRDVILMNPADIGRLGLKVNQRAVVQSPVGAMRGILVRECEVRAGNAAMYFPEANVLVPSEADAESKTPAFKNVPITVTPDTTPPASRLTHLELPKNTAFVPSTLNAC